MFLFLLFVIIPFLYFTYITVVKELIPEYKAKKTKLSRRIMGCLSTTVAIAFVVFIIGGVISLGILTFAYSVSEDKYELYGERKLIAMKDSSTFIVSRHSGSEEMKYYYMYKLNNAIRSRSTPQNKTVIYEDTIKEKSNLQVYRKEFKNKFWLNEAKWIEKYFSINMMTDYYYEFHVPKGTVHQEFNIDLE